MLVTGSPQFQLQDDFGFGDGIRLLSLPDSDPLSEDNLQSLLHFTDLEVDPTVEDTLVRLKVIFRQHEDPDLESLPKTLTSTTNLHELTCFVLHKLLTLPSHDPGPNSASECLRYGTCVYMFIIHGPTYYSHATILNNLVLQLRDHLEMFLSSSNYKSSLVLWLLSVGLVGSFGTESHHWFVNQTAALSASFDVRCWEHVEKTLRTVLWYDTKYTRMFGQVWVQIIESNPTHLNVAGAAGDPQWRVTSSPQEG